MTFSSISSPNLSFIPETISEKIDAEVTNTAFSIGSVRPKEFKGIQVMQAVSNLPTAVQIRRQALIGRFKLLNKIIRLLICMQTNIKVPVFFMFQSVILCCSALKLY